MKKFVSIIKKELEDYKVLLRSIPALILSLYILSIVLMNIFASKEITTNLNYLRLDSGIVYSWIAFLTADVITKRFGPKAAIKISILGLVVNLFFALTFLLITKISGNWSSFYTYNDSMANDAINDVFSFNYVIVFSSSLAFFVSSVLNAILMYLINKKFKKDNYIAFSISAHTSTFISQFVDNFLFALLVSHTLFGWDMITCVVCALTGAVVEMLFELIFSHLGYLTLKKWEREDVGILYLNYINKEE